MIGDVIEVTYLIGPGATDTERVTAMTKGGSVVFIPAGEAAEGVKNGQPLDRAPAGIHMVVEYSHGLHPVQRLFISAAAFVSAVERPRR